MKSFLIVKEINSKKIKKMKTDWDSYDFIPKIKNKAYLKVDKVRIINEECITRLINLKLETKLKNIISMSLKALNDDEDDSSAVVALDELHRLMELIIRGYAKYLSLEQVKNALRKLYNLEKELEKKKLLMNQMRMNSSSENEIHHSK